MTLEKKELGIRIKEARKIKSKKIATKYTGQNLSDELQISRGYLGDIEAGRIYPSYRLLSKIANICGVPLSFFGDTDTLLKEIIDKKCPDMNEEEKNQFCFYIKNGVNSPDSLLDWDLDVWLDDFDNSKADVPELTTRECEVLEQVKQEYYKSEEERYKNMTFKDGIEFKTPESAMKFILKQPAIMGYGGFDINKMADEEIVEFANELLNQLKLLGYKYKK